MNICFKGSNISKTMSYIYQISDVKGKNEWDTKYFKCVLKNEGSNYIKSNLTLKKFDKI